MSQTASDTNQIEEIAQRINQTASMYIKDLEHIPEDKFGVSPMGCARTPYDFTAEVIWLNNLCARFFRGEAPDNRGEEERKEILESLDSAKTAIEKFRESVDGVTDAFRKLEESELSKEIPGPWGSPTTFSGMGNFVALHLAYHDGQLNYIQSLYGDGEIHWM